MDKTFIAALIGTLVPTVIFFIIVLVACFFRSRQPEIAGGYTPVNHGLDDEEMEFKRMIENQGDDVEKLFAHRVDSVGDYEDVEFDSKELDNLQMLDEYRDNLVSGSIELTKPAVDIENNNNSYNYKTLESKGDESPDELRL